MFRFQTHLLSLLCCSLISTAYVEDPSHEEEIVYDYLDEYSNDAYYNDVGPPFDNYEALPIPRSAKETELPPSKEPQELNIDLKNPTFAQGIIHTDDGGIITGAGLRIQAQKIDYINKIENGIRVQKIAAEGDLMIEFSDRVFVGTRLEYDFISRTGTLWDGKTFVDMWFLGGDRIDLKDDGTFYIYNAFVTTSESQVNDWELDAESIQITENHLLSAKNISLKLFKVPFFWLPAFKSNLKSGSDSPIRYKVVWDKGIGPRVTARYRFFSWRDLNLFFRLDYRIKHGFGGALESEYLSPSGMTTFVTRSYGAYDKSFSYEAGWKRYRLQGLYHTASADNKTQVHLTYDKLHDYQMAGDFKSSDFEINTQMITQFSVKHTADDGFINFNVRPRINPFQSINQELPFVSVGIRPLQLGESGIISNNYVNAGYLDYVYDTGLRNKFRALHLTSSTHAARIETKNELYRPCHMGPVTFTPNVGIVAIFYNNNPQGDAAGQGVLTYGAELKTSLSRSFPRVKHTLEPYINFKGLSRPTVSSNDHFFFDINDGYNQLNQLRFGVRNNFLKSNPFLPTITTDLYTYGFFGSKAFAPVLPKYYLDLGWNRPSFSVNGSFAWNQEERVWDFTNIRSAWTINEDLAFGIEFRHRSRFDWRKADHTNFILDVAQPIPELLESPLSDGRNTLLARFQIRLGPKWSCHIETRNGWGRKNEPSYYAGKLDLLTLITWNWGLRLTYERLPGDNRFSGAFSLIK